MAHRTALLAAAALSIGSLAGPGLTPTAGAAEPACDGKPATIVVTDDNVATYWNPGHARYEVDGTGGDDVIVSTVTEVPGAEEGDIFLLGLGGDDTICAGPLVSDEEAFETRYGVRPVLDGGNGSDTLVGSTDSEVFAHVADPTDGVNTIKDPGGDDLFDQWSIRAPGAAHVPVLIDVPNQVIAGDGIDVRLEGAVEGFEGGDDDEFLGGPGAETFWARGSRNRIVMGAGNDTLHLQGAGPHWVNTGDGKDLVFNGPGRDAHVNLGPGHDRMWLAGHAIVKGDSGNDTFLVSAQVSSPAFRASVDGGTGTNRISFSSVFSGGVRAYLDQGISYFGGSVLRSTRVGRLTGSGYADVLAGDATANQISGDGGNDRLVGRAGNDILVGDGGSDRAEGGPGADTCTAETRTSC